MNNLFAKAKAGLCLGIALIGTLNSNAQQLPAKSKIVADMALANSYFMKKWPDPGATTTVKNPAGVPVTRTSNL